ncbi:O-unit flippase-like protein [Collinsella ihumii]|uniref:O-unit flippase-like protein n=1 Tax=Collinsella ihumii TaxID=1720204 RepID=UPI0008372CB8|nr:O-unit flippase-like protein [Collinsella ihumii]
MNSNKISVGKRDVIWNYIGTIMSMVSNFLLMPLLLIFLSTEQIGLWYVFIAVSGFSSLLEFGFTATLSRNILYVLSGARRLTKEGCDCSSVEDGVDWHLMRAVLRTSKTIYAVMGVVALALSVTVGTAYVSGVTRGFSINGSLPSWCIFVVAIFTNLYFLYCLTFLRGVGDVAGENKAKTLARLIQLLLTALLLFMGFGLLAAALGVLFYSILLRAIANSEFHKHRDVQEGLRSDVGAVTGAEMRSVLGTVSFVAWRDGVVSLAWYGATQATSLLSSMFLGLEQTATYSVMIQFASAIYNLSSTYMRSCFPTFQAAYVSGDRSSQRKLLDRGMSCYVVMYLIGVLLAAFAALPILTFFKRGFVCDRMLFFGIAVYYFLLNQHSLFCNIIVSMNKIPYFKAYLISTAAGIALSCVLCGSFGLGAWGLVLGQAIPQLLYNNWRWPKYVLDFVKTTYLGMLIAGFQWWATKVLRTIECVWNDAV